VINLNIFDILKSGWTHPGPILDPADSSSDGGANLAFEFVHKRSEARHLGKPLAAALEIISVIQRFYGKKMKKTTF
jgi:hypothetical protein